MQNYEFGVKKDDAKVAGTDRVIPGRKVIYREDTGDPISIVSDKYNLIPHADIVNSFETMLDGLGEKFAERQVTTYLPENGAKMFRKYIFPKIQVAVKPGDLINLTLEVQNSYDGSLRGGFMFGAYRLVCTNGLTIGAKVQELYKKHYAALDFEKAAQGLKLSIPIFESAIGQWREWHEIKMKDADALAFLEKSGLNAKTMEAVMQQFAKEEKSKWGLFQAVTYHTTHQLTSRKAENTRWAQVQMEQVITPVFYGKKGVLVAN